MKNLLILRHAKSSWKDETLSDHDRPLNKRGKEAAPRVGELMSRENLLPDLILCSSALRARSTAELAVAEFERPVEIRVLDELYAAEPEDILRVLRAADDHCDNVLVVGHNPGLEVLVGHLTGQAQPMPTAALAYIELPIERWSEISPRTRGVLEGFWSPKDQN